MGHSGGNAGPKQSQFSTADARPGGAKASAPDHPASAGASASLVKMTMQAGGGCARAAKAPPRCVQRLWLSFFVSGEVAVSNAGFLLCTLPASLTICPVQQGPAQHDAHRRAAAAWHAERCVWGNKRTRGGRCTQLFAGKCRGRCGNAPNGFKSCWSSFPARGI